MELCNKFEKLGNVMLLSKILYIQNSAGPYRSAHTFLCAQTHTPF